MRFNYSIKELKNTMLSINSYKIIPKTKEKLPLASYKVDLLTIATGPIYHSIDLRHFRTGNNCGKMSVNI
jgi:hypothetical protein